MTPNKYTSLLFISVISIMLFSACDTISGVGKDIQKAGKVIENEANKR